MEAHKSFRTSERLSPLAIISGVCFSAANRGCAWRGGGGFGLRWGCGIRSLSRFRSSRLRPVRGITESYLVVRFESPFRGVHHILHLWVPVYDPFVITYALGTAHPTGARSHSIIKLRFSMRRSNQRASRVP